MAPSAPTRPRLTLKGVERKRPGPAPKPLSERLKSKPLKQVKRIERSYTRERKIEVLNYLLNHRVPDGRRTTAPRRRIGQPPAQELVSPPPTVREENGEYVWYRAPTYAEASDFWKIPTPTIQGWWDRRKKLLAGTGIEVPEVAERPSPARRAPTGASTAPNRSAQPAAAPREGAQGAAQGESDEQQRDGDSAPENEATPATSSSAPSPNPNPNPNPTPQPPRSNGTPLRAVERTSSNARRVQPPPAAQPTPAGTGQQPDTTSRAQLLGTPIAPRPPANVAQPAPRPAPQVFAAPILKSQAARPTDHPPPVDLPPAFNPANYVVVYIGPPPGPQPNQHCIHPGAILPVVYSGQPLDVPPMSYVSVFPSHPPPPGPRPPPPPPDALYVDGVVHDAPPPPFPGQRPPHRPSGHPEPHNPPSQGQPTMPHGSQPRPQQDPGHPLISRPHPQQQSGGPPPHAARPALNGPRDAARHVDQPPPSQRAPTAPPNSAAQPGTYLHPGLTFPRRTTRPPPAAQAQPTRASSGPPPTPPTHAADTQVRPATTASAAQHPPPAVPGSQQPAQTAFRSASPGSGQPPAEAATKAHAPLIHAAESTETAEVPSTQRQQQEHSDGTDVPMLEREDSGSSSPSTEGVSQTHEADADAARFAPPSKATSTSQTEKAGALVNTTAAPQKDTATTPMETTATLEENATATSMESDARKLPAGTRTETTTTSMDIDTEAPADTPGRVDSLFGSGVSTPAVS